MPFCFNLKITPLCQTLSNAFEISRKTPLISNPSLKDLYTLWVIDKSWLIHKTPSFRPDWFEEIILFYVRNLNILLNMSLSSVFPQIGSNETGRYFSKNCLKKPESMHSLKINCKSLQTDLLQIFVIANTDLIMTVTFIGFV